MTQTNVLFPLGGALAGAYTYSTIGGIGLVGGFGGVGLGLGTMAVVGSIAGSALYGGLQGGKDAYVATTLGVLGGATVYNSIGGVGLGIGGTAFGIGLGTMALSGGILGLGIYGITKILNDDSPKESFAEIYFRVEEKIVEQELYNQAIMELTSPELSWQYQWANIEIEHELKQLKKVIQPALESQKKSGNTLDNLQQKRKVLMEELKTTYSSSKKFDLLQQIDKIEEKIKHFKF
ncbi:hypothetical protein ACN4EE_10230 [Geminocystis sp. CENA526]|uniref:hypothetical protein n=1 Tax=Geminocystis sp. CENA526 TaxID=1355871 RepID=UPI003D6EDC9E